MPHILQIVTLRKIFVQSIVIDRSIAFGSCQNNQFYLFLQLLLNESDNSKINSRLMQ